MINFNYEIKLTEDLLYNPIMYKIRKSTYETIVPTG